MVEAGTKTRAQMGDELIVKVNEYFSKAEEYPVVIEKEEGNVLVRQTWDGDKMVSIAESKRVDGLKPEDFKEFFTRWPEKEVGLKANSILKDCIKCEETEDCPVVKLIVDTPWPIWNRCIIATIYLRLDQENGDQIMVFSCDNNEEQKEKHFSAKDKKNYVMANQYVGGWIASPIKDESGEVVATHLKYVNSSSANGNIPQFVQKSEGPKTAIEPIIGTIKWVRDSQK